jgi:hypothetical protein
VIRVKGKNYRLRERAPDVAPAAHALAPQLLLNGATSLNQRGLAAYFSTSESGALSPALNRGLGAAMNAKREGVEVSSG